MTTPNLRDNAELLLSVYKLVCEHDSNQPDGFIARAFAREQTAACILDAVQAALVAPSEPCDPRKRRPGRPRGTTRGGSHVVSIRVNDTLLACLTSGGFKASAVLKELVRQWAYRGAS